MKEVFLPIQLDMKTVCCSWPFIVFTFHPNEQIYIYPDCNPGTCSIFCRGIFCLLGVLGQRGGIYILLYIYTCLETRIS